MMEEPIPERERPISRRTESEALHPSARSCGSCIVDGLEVDVERQPGTMLCAAGRSGQLNCNKAPVLFADERLLVWGLQRVPSPLVARGGDEACHAATAVLARSRWSVYMRHSM